MAHPIKPGSRRVRAIVKQRMGAAEIRCCKADLGLRNADIAQEAGLTVDTVARCLEGDTLPHRGSLDAIEAALVKLGAKIERP